MAGYEELRVARMKRNLAWARDTLDRVVAAEGAELVAALGDLFVYATDIRETAGLLYTARPLCACQWTDTGDAENGPSLTIIALNPDCPWPEHALEAKADSSDWPVHQPAAPDAPIPGRWWFRSCSPDEPRVSPAGICSDCGAKACSTCGKEDCPDHELSFTA